MEYTILDYVWIGGKGELRSKVRVCHGMSITKLEDVPEWNFDGSSTGQEDGTSSEIFLRPVKIVPCPFEKNGAWIVLCECYQANGSPAKYNHRHEAKKIFDQYRNQEPWFGIECEIFIYDCKTNQPIGFNQNESQFRFYCGVGGNNAFNLRQLMHEHMHACLYAGLKISGVNLEVAPGQIEYQLGPIEGIDAADQVWIARYLLERITEKYGWYVQYHPKPLIGDWNGSGMHHNVSTKAMREPGGYNVILSSMQKLKNKHAEDILNFGEYNQQRMTGQHETSRFDQFSFGIANRKCSIRIPTDTVNKGCGYYEDRRPASNCDPYIVTSTILRTLME